MSSDYEMDRTCTICGATHPEDEMTMCEDCPGFHWICESHMTLDEYKERCDACEAKRRAKREADGPSDAELSIVG